MDLGLNGRTALVCGASSGLGLASAEALAGEGANVTMLARRRDELERQADRIGALAVVGDVTIPQHTERAVEKTIEAFGALDILVWNHGGPPPGTGSDVTPDGVELAVELMVQPLVRLVTQTLPHLERSPAGRIVAITSLAAKEPTEHLALSNMFRPSIHGYLKTLADELGPRGITVNCVAPGFITSAMTDKLNEKQREAILGTIPTGRLGTGAEVAAAVVYLASNEAAYVTGQTLHVNGGMAMI